MSEPETESEDGPVRSTVQTLALLCALVLLLGIVLDQAGGVVHHYDVGSQIAHIRELESALTESDTTLQRRLDTLKYEVLRNMEDRQAQIGGNPQLGWTGISARIALVLMLLIGAILFGNSTFFRSESQSA